MLFALSQYKFLLVVFAINGIDGLINGLLILCWQQDFLRVQWVFCSVRTMVKSVFLGLLRFAFSQSNRGRFRQL